MVSCNIDIINIFTFTIWGPRDWGSLSISCSSLVTAWYLSFHSVDFSWLISSSGSGTSTLVLTLVCGQRTGEEYSHMLSQAHTHTHKHDTYTHAHMYTHTHACMHACTHTDRQTHLCFWLDFSAGFLNNRLFTPNGTTSWMSLLMIRCTLWSRSWLLWSSATIEWTCKASLPGWLYISGKVPNTL